ncbi:hypothetical protein DPMN_140225 [Dreissena polymorpha]|uniref:Sushi domain-containing protein n=1 Tax=Dreissena polymorpha TaxID=45954 RepID=A0A9D4G778_DREPO|nr:hypothetical protein DPMN_140225 [Dreissena polymorpha]
MTAKYIIFPDCPQFIKPKNATVEGESITVGSTRTLKCDNNYKPLNESKIKSVCDNGMWSSTTICVPEKCVYPAFEFNQSIYLFTNLSTSFDTAAEYCTGCDGHVITIDDEKEQEWVDETAPNIYTLSGWVLGTQTKTGTGTIPALRGNMIKYTCLTIIGQAINLTTTKMIRSVLKSAKLFIGSGTIGRAVLHIL